MLILRLASIQLAKKKQSGAQIARLTTSYGIQNKKKAANATFLC
jgi:hypothetical protein